MSGFSSRPGAVTTTEGIDAGAIAHYGNPLAEQRALDEGRAVVELAGRSVIELHGPDRLTWINTITSGEVRFLQPGDSSETLFLDNQGHIEYAVGLIDDGSSLWLLAEGSTAEALLAWLLKMRFRMQVEITDRSAEYRRIGFVRRPGSVIADTLPIAAVDGVPLLWNDPWSGITEGGWQYATDSAHPGTDYLWSEALVAVADLAAITLPVAGVLSAEALRVSAWRPRQATEVDEKSIPHESDWLRSAVHLNKGCYRGQETVAKVHNLGHPPRRLVFLDLDGSAGALPPVGAAIRAYRDGVPRIIGFISSVALHHEEGPIALALIKRAVPEDAALEVALDPATRVVPGQSAPEAEAEGEWIAANQRTIVPGDAGATANVPRLPRIGSTRR